MKPRPHRSSRSRTLPLAALALAACSLAACVARDVAPGQFFDERTARTLLAAARPLVFARNRSDVAAHARDYATLEAVEIDESGDYRQYLLLYRWSTVDRRMVPDPDARAGALRIVADGRVIELAPLEELPLSLDRRTELQIPNHGDAVVHAYRVSVELLRYLAASRELVVRMPQEPLVTSFELWEDGRGALAGFLSRAAAP